MFSLSFLNAGWLILSLSAVIPVIIYFFAKKRPDKVIFSSLKFIRESKEERNNRINLKNILLLIIRTLIILFICLLFARPVFNSFFKKNSSYHAPTSISVIADNSLSLEYYEKDLPRIEKSKSIISDINNRLTNQDYIRVYTKDDYITAKKFSLGTVNDSLISNITTTTSNVSLDSLIAQASRNLVEAKTANNELYLITDFNESFSYSDSLVKVKVINVASKDTWINLSNVISNIEIKKVNDSKIISIDFIVNNFSTKDIKDKLVRLNYNSRSYDKFISINANTSVQSNFSIPIESTGWQKGFIDIQDEFLENDNRSYFSFFYNLQPRIAVISQQRKLSLPWDIILNIFSNNKDNISYFNPNSINNKLINGYDIVIFYKLDNYDNNIRSLIDYLEQRKQRYVTILGDKVNKSTQDFVANRYNIELDRDDLRDIVPDWYNEYNPLMKAINSNQLRELRFSDVVPATYRSRDNILFSADKQPLLAKSSVGYLVFFDDNNEFVVSSSFPVFANLILEEITDNRIIINQNYVNTSLDLPKEALVNGKKILGHSYTFMKPGIYKITIAGKDSYYAVNLAVENLKEGEQGSFDLPESYLDATNNWQDELFSDSKKFELVSWLIYIILFLFLCELVVIKIM